MRRPTWYFIIAVLSLLAATFVVALLAPRDTRAQDQEWPEHAFVPLVLKRARQSDFARVGTAGPTVPRTPTVKRPPTRTPEPTETPTPEGGAVTVSGRLLENDQPAAEGLGSGTGGPGLFLRQCSGNETTCQILGRTGVDNAGRYRFQVAVDLQPGDFLQVVWRNEYGTYGNYELGGMATMLGQWAGPHITQASAGDKIEMPDIEISGIDLLAPTKGTGFSGDPSPFPIDFVWSPWAGPVQRYKWSICRCCQMLDQRVTAHQANTGTSTGYQLADFPPGTRTDPNDKLCWYIHVDMAGSRGWGQSFEARMMWFFLEVFTPFGTVDTADWGAGAAALAPRSARPAPGGDW
jgi:hypothetical protein